MLSRENCGYYPQFATILNAYTHKNPHTDNGAFPALPAIS